MKHTIKLFITSILISFLIVSCNDDDSNEREPVNNLPTINLEANTLIQFILLDNKDDGEEVVENEFIPLLEQTITNSGGVFLGAFNTISVEEGNLTPQQFRIYKWPDITAIEAFQNDQNHIELESIETNALRNVTIGYGLAGADVNYQFDQNKVYELYSANIIDFDLITQFGPIQQIANEEYGRNEFLPLIGTTDIQGGWSFMVGGIVEWPDEQTLFEFLHLDSFLNGIENYRNPATENLLLINGKYIIQ